MGVGFIRLDSKLKTKVSKLDSMFSLYFESIRLDSIFFESYLDSVRLDSKSMLGFVLLVSCGSRKSAASQLPLCECGRVLSQQVRCGLEGVCAKF